MSGDDNSGTGNDSGDHAGTADVDGAVDVSVDVNVDSGLASQPEPEPSLVRSFLTRLKPQTGSNRFDGVPLEEPTEAAAVRSYAMTGGRSTSVIPLEFESMLQATSLGSVSMPSLTFERNSIVQLCSAEILSVAELSARLHVPIGVVRVVAADLVSEGLLEAFMSNLSVADDVSLITRLIEGVRAL